jgi:hypothetical protein
LALSGAICAWEKSRSGLNRLSAALSSGPPADFSFSFPNSESQVPFPEYTPVTNSKLGMAAGVCVAMRSALVA